MIAVKNRMLSRRDMFRLAAAGSVAAAVTVTSSAIPAMAATPTKVSDLTHELSESFPTFFGEQQFFVNKLFDYQKDKFNLYELRVNEHTGTHVDAPLHFSEDGQSVAEIPVSNLIAPLAIVDIRAKAAENADAQVTPDDLKAWIAANGAIPDGACVAMLSGWDKHVASPKFRNPDDKGVMHFPGFHVEAAAMLIEEAKVVGIAVDTLSLDFGASPDFATHYKWLPSNRWGIECIANLEQLPVTGATLVVGAPKHKGGTGGPARVLALV